MEYLSYQISQCDDYDDHQENEQVDITESHDEFRDRIIRYYLRKQSRFPTPSKPVIFSGKLHPYRVYAVLWHHTDICHNQKLVLLTENESTERPLTNSSGCCRIKWIESLNTIKLYLLV